ncbi:MAG: hypothetical protein ABJF11_10495 [Reichenbachiella sp.]|uniref:aldose 1-epimerase n=1 Tax=Reichenbachiella sp. TaxID=2184521 RepID=UPI0032635B3B
MFKVQKHKLGRFDAVRLINDSTGEYLEVLSEFGAGLNTLVIKNGEDQLISVLDGYQSETEIFEQHHFAYRGSKLSPIPNRVYKGKYKFDNQSYQLPINEVKANNSLHGFLHNRPFEQIEEYEGEDKAAVKMVHSYKGIDRGYPFSYEIAVSYHFDATGLTVQTDIENVSVTTIPIGDGWHPYFSFENLDDIFFQMNPTKRVYSGVGNKLSGTHGFESAKVIGKTKFDDCFEIADNENFAVRLKDENRHFELEIWQDSEDKKYKYVQIYTPPDRKSIALEPVTCAPNAFNTGQGLIELKPNEKVSMSFGIKNILQNN